MGGTKKDWVDEFVERSVEDVAVGLEDNQLPEDIASCSDPGGRAGQPRPCLHRMSDTCT